MEVVAEAPNHPEGVVRPRYRRHAVVRETMDGFGVRYVWVRASPRKSAPSRILLYGTYAAMATAVGSLLRRPDVVLASSPPLPTGAAAALVAARHRVPWVLDVRDLWPEAAVILGELSDPRAIRLAERLERRLYRSAAAVVTVTEPFRAQIAAAAGDETKVAVIPNGTTRLWLEAGETEVARTELGLPEDRFLWAYAGNLGIAQGLDAAMDAAAELGDAFHLLLLGAGPVRARLEERAASLAPGRVSFRDPVEPELAARYMRAADALLVPLDARPELAKYVPSKLFDCCAVGRPVIVAAAGESARLAGEAGAALTIPPSDGPALTEAVLRLRQDTGLREQLSEAGRRFAGDYLRESQVEQLEQVLASVVR